MMAAQQFLRAAAQRSIAVSVNGDNLAISAPPGALTDDMMAAAKEHKAEIIEFLRERQVAANIECLEQATLDLMSFDYTPETFGRFRTLASQWLPWLDTGGRLTQAARVVARVISRAQVAKDARIEEHAQRLWAELEHVCERWARS